MADVQTLFAKVTESFSHLIQKSELARNEITIEVAPESLHDICVALRDAPEFDFKMLIDVCGVDYLHFGIAEWETETATLTGFSRGTDKSAIELHNRKKMENEFYQLEPFAAEEEQIHPKSRFATVYHLLSLTHNHRLRIRVFLDKHEPKVPSVIDIWPAANWFEREAFDMFGIVFTGHPDLRRILTDYGFAGHPFRKDFPLIGKVAVRYDAKQKRVIYEPVDIVPRVLEPKVIRHDNRYEVGE